MEKQKKAVIYARQSSGNDDLSLSVEDQISRAIQYAEANNIYIIDIYRELNCPGELYPLTAEAKGFCITDRAWQNWRKSRSFTKNYRIELGKLFEKIETEKVDYIIISERTRLYRSPNNSFLDGYICNFLRDNKISIIETTTNSIDQLNNVVDIAVQRLLATYEMQKIDEKAEQSKRVRADKKAKGEYFSNAYGTVWKDKKLFFDNDKAKVIKYVYDSVLKGKTYSEILYNMNTVFFDFRTETKGKKAKCFYESSIYNILSNPIYSGYFKNDDEYTKIENMGSDPLISFSTYLEIQNIIKNKKVGNQKFVGDKKGNFLPFSGLLICGNCGKKLSVVNDDGIVYSCHNTILLKNKSCTPSRIRFYMGNDDDDFLFAFQPLLAIKLFANMYKLNQIISSNSQKDSLKAEIETLQNKIATVTKTFIDNGFNSSTFANLLSEIKNTLIEKQNQLLAMQNVDSENAENFLKMYRANFDKVTMNEKLLDQDTYRRLLHDTVNQIFVYDDKIKVVLYDDNVFEIPRIKGKRRSKKLPYAKAETFVVDNMIKVVITFGEGENIKTVLKTANYEIRIKD